LPKAPVREHVRNDLGLGEHGAEASAEANAEANVEAYAEAQKGTPRQSVSENQFKS
jgi:hypothetical protein